MIAEFFDTQFVISKLRKTGNKKRWTATATVDGSLQDNDDSVNQQMGAEYQEKYVLYADISYRALFQIGRLVKNKPDGIEYTIDKVNKLSHPITGTEYIEVFLIKSRSASDGSKNWGVT